MSSNNDIKKQNNTNILGQKIKETRKEKKLTQKALAELIGKSPEAVRKYETGERQPPISVLYDICDALGVPVSSFIPEDNTALKNQSEIIEIGKTTVFDRGVLKILESLGYGLVVEPSDFKQFEDYFEHGKPFGKIHLSYKLFTPDDKMIEVPEERWEQFEENIKNYFKFELFNISNESDK
ncbi:MAG: helix-turn-helix transcriptional regulator [Clostridium sp.]|nr:helix-turn-helix transcriptional regulator [Clostridium sp.]